MGFPVHRLRRLRKNEYLRNMVRENRLNVENFICPLFAVHGNGVKQEISILPGNYHLSVDRIVEEAKEIRDLGIPAVLLFGVPQSKNLEATEAYDHNGIVQRAVRAIKEEVPQLVVITDVCLCEYTPHGHCGVIKDGYLDNDSSLELIEKVTVSHAQAGADIVAPAAMLDGQISRMRKVLDESSHTNVAIMAYSAKFASKLYDPFFKEGTESVLEFGDKRTHQMDCANAFEALREIALDIEEGADIVMVKPAMFYLDVVYRAKERFKVPLAIYNVSGEYAMLKAASSIGKIDEFEIRNEMLTSFKRAGADLIISYHAKEIAHNLNR
ncbi:porphobilinogen synthase [Chitinispirillales bacterium ANBcel5]|uniref:porphobilinogen synthase n=1 Tax=Cellulosispirillum alkaliphilum TaxID=3039283 RepID=UPI002A5683F7|nr:porphobilinogen synthase [Chitinispirillales bacterium ANBcel5]